MTAAAAIATPMCVHLSVAIAPYSTSLCLCTCAVSGEPFLRKGLCCLSCTKLRIFSNHVIMIAKTLACPSKQDSDAQTGRGTAQLRAGCRQATPPSRQRDPAASPQASAARSAPAQPVQPWRCRGQLPVGGQQIGEIQSSSPKTCSCHAGGRCTVALSGREMSGRATAAATSATKSSTTPRSCDRGEGSDPPPWRGGGALAQQEPLPAQPLVLISREPGLLLFLPHGSPLTARRPGGGGGRPRRRPPHRPRPRRPPSAARVTARTPAAALAPRT